MPVRQLNLRLLKLIVDVVAVIADDEGCVEEPATAEVVRPAQGARGVAPSVVHALRLIDAAHGLNDIVASIEREINAVVLPDFGVDFRVQVVESRHKRHIFVGLHEKVDETPACRNQVRSLFLDDGAIGGQSGGKGTQRHREIVVVHVAFLHLAVEDGRDAPAVLRGHVALVKRHLVHGLGVEDGDHAEEVRGVVDGSLVDEDEVLVVGAAAHEQPRRGVADGLHARLHLHRLEDVGLAKHARQFAYRVDGQHLGMELVLLLRTLHSCRLNSDFTQTHSVFLQLDFQGLVGIELNFYFFGVVAQIGALQLVFSSGQTQRIEAVAIGRGACLRGGLI